MKISMITPSGGRKLHNIVKALTPLQERIEVHIYAPDRDDSVDETRTAGSNIVYSESFEDNLAGTDMVFNLIGCPEPDYAAYQDLADRHNVELQNSRTIAALLGGEKIWKGIDRLAAAIKDARIQETVVINAGGMSNIITAYLHGAHRVISYGASKKADKVVDTLLKATSMNDFEETWACKLAGVSDHLWLAEINDQGGRDIYPRLREKVRELDLNLTRNDLTRDGLRSMKFYGYYHSANVPDQPTEEIIFKIISAYLSKEKTMVYLDAINGDSIDGLDRDAVVEIPFIFDECKLKREKVNLPFPCILIIDDLAGAVILTVKALVSRSVTMFKRALKLDPYLAPLLTLAELEDLAEGIFRRGGLAGFFKEE